MVSCAEFLNMSDYVCFYRKLFGKTDEGSLIKRLVDDEENRDSEVVAKKVPKVEKPSDILTLVSLELICFGGAFVLFYCHKS